MKKEVAKKNIGHLNYKIKWSKVNWFLISIFILSLFIFNCPVVVNASDANTALRENELLKSNKQGKGESIEKKINEEKYKDKDLIFKYVNKIYQEYAAENFKYIYSLLYPELKEVVTEDEYIDFQEHNFKKYHYKIEDIKVNEEMSFINLSHEYKDYIESISEEDKICKIVVSYTIKFKASGKEKTRDVDNEVLVFEENEVLYLIWDPSII
ncbi:MAG: hypothetical protein ACOCQW_05305 [Halanaerobiaceae bacterium]